MLGANLKETVGNLAIFSMVVELVLWVVFVQFRQYKGNPIQYNISWRVVALILTVGMLGAIIAPILVVTQK
jgi:hypothetical protein